ncbi:MAG: hypothetical protein AB1609_07730 [Bacillota bacterium]
MRLRQLSAVLVLAAAVALVLFFASGGAALAAARPGPEQLQAVSPRPQFISPYPPVALVAALGLVAGAVWLTYAYVLYQVWRIATRP